MYGKSCSSEKAESNIVCRLQPRDQVHHKFNKTVANEKPQHPNKTHFKLSFASFHSCTPSERDLYLINFHFAYTKRFSG